MRLKQNLLCFLCRSLSFLVKLEQLDLGGNDLEVLVRRGQGRGRGQAGLGGGEPLSQPIPSLFCSLTLWGLCPICGSCGWTGTSCQLCLR